MAEPETTPTEVLQIAKSESEEAPAPAPPEVAVPGDEGREQVEVRGEEKGKEEEEEEVSVPGETAPDHKRKHEEVEAAHERKEEEEEQKKPEDSCAAPEETKEGEEPDGQAKRQRVDGDTDGLGVEGRHEGWREEAPPEMNGQHTSTENLQPISAEDLPKTTAEFPQHDDISSTGHLATSELALPMPSRKIEVPNNKVGVLIGKAGETIRFLQINSGAKIQITRDVEADPQSSTRPVELTGSLESISKAEQLIRDVITEAEAGGSPALVARGFGTVQSGAEQIEIQVANEKVGLIIGKGGETIKNLQTRSGARIQLIPQHLPEGDESKERTVRITGKMEQIEVAKDMIKEVISQVPRPTPYSDGYSQQTYRPHGPSTATHWGPRPQPRMQPVMGLEYQQRGMYPSQSTQYPPQSYGSYSQQPLPRSGMSANWDQRAGAPAQAPSQAGGYNYYKQGSPALGTQPFSTLPAPGTSPGYYGQPKSTGYGQLTPYQQSAPMQQTYGHRYDQPKYDAHAPGQQFYEQQHVSSQPALQSSYPQRHDLYGQQSYGPLPSQPGDTMYQGPAPSSYGPGAAPAQQSYPYGSDAPSQPAPAYGQTYGPASGSADGYTQPAPAGYSQHAGQGGLHGASNTQQGAPSAGYGQYPSSQQGYADQPASNNVNYGYQGGPTDAGYGNGLPNSAYGATAASSQAGYGQAGYVQPASNPSGYEQLMPPQQMSYGGYPGSAPVGYTKGPSPQPGYGGQQ
ncbi:uncharacterized protein [Typha latifolia]|uniref:uncharacterized protein n=1 Tax=Typha latifolia TaxID=4733 RepID=UPI003C2F8354